MGTGMLNFNIEGSGRLAESNKSYSNAELKNMFKNKAEREAFLKKQNSISAFNKSFESNLSSYINQKDLSESQKLETQKQNDKGILKNKLSESGDFFKYNYGPNQISSDIGYSQAQYNFSKLSPEERSTKINNWLSGYAGNISQLNIDDANDSEYAQKIFGSNYKDVVSQIKGKFTNGVINTTDYPALANLLQVNLQTDILKNPDMINKWSSFNIVNPSQTTPIVAAEEFITDSSGTVLKDNKPYTGAYNDLEFQEGLPFSGEKNNLMYQQGKPYTGYVSPKFDESASAQNVVNIYNPKNYGGYVGGKRLADEEFYNYVDKLPAAEKAKYEKYYDALHNNYNAIPSEYVDLSKITDTNKTIVDYLRRNKLGNYGLDITKYYNVSPGGRMIQMVDTEKSKQSASPWTSTIKNYRVYTDQSGKIYHEPFSIETDPKTGEDIAVFNRDGKRFVTRLGKNSMPKEGYETKDFSIPMFGKTLYKKNGGMIPKLQLGGGFMSSMNYDAGKASDQEKKVSSISQQKLKGSMINPLSQKPEGFKLTAADYADLAALALDAGSLAFQAVPVYGNAISAGAGVGSSLSTAYGDYARDKEFSGSDAISLAGNLALDAASLIPVIGVGSKGAKIGKSIKMLEPTLKLASVALAAKGMTDASSSIVKAISNPDEMTVDDWKMVVSGLNQVVSGGKGYANQIGKVKTKQNFFNVKNQDGSMQKVQLKPEQLEKLNSIKSGDQKTEFLQTVANQNLKGSAAQATVDAGRKMTGLKVGWNPIKTEANPKIQTESSYRFKTEQELEGANPLTKYFANRNRQFSEGTGTNLYKKGFNSIFGRNKGNTPAISEVSPNQKIEPIIVDNKKRGTLSFKPIINKKPILKPDVEKTKVENKTIIQPQIVKTNTSNQQSFKAPVTTQGKRVFYKPGHQSKVEAKNNSKQKTANKKVDKGRVAKAQKGMILNPINAKPLVQKQLIPSSFTGYKPNLAHLQGSNEGRMVRFDKPTFEKPVFYNQQSVNLNKQSADFGQNKKNNKTSLLSKVDPIMAADLARTLAGNIANSQMNTKITTPIFQQASETYMSPASTQMRDAYYRSASRLQNSKPQTSDALSNELIRKSNLAKAEDIRLQGEGILSQQNEEIKRQNNSLTSEYAGQRNAIANQNLENMSQAENQRVQLWNMRRSMNAENIQNFATRWLMSADKQSQENKSINQQIALNNLSRQVTPETSRILEESNKIRDLAKTQGRSLTPQETTRLKELEKTNYNYSNMISNLQLQAMKNPNIKFDIASEKPKFNIFKSGGQINAIDKYNMMNDNRLNRMMEKKYETSLKYRMEFLKEILKNNKK